MKRILLSVALATLAACATTPKTGPQAAFQLESDYLIAVKAETAYKSRPTCTTPTTVVLCKTDANVTKMLSADDKAWSSIQTAVHALRDPSITQSNLQATLVAAQAALDILTSITGAP